MGRGCGGRLGGGCGYCYACRIVCRSVLLVCWAVWSVHFLCGEHHDRWYCQSTMVKSCHSGGLVIHRVMMAVWEVRSQMGRMYGAAVFRHCCVLSCIHHQRDVGVITCVCVCVGLWTHSYTSRRTMVVKMTVQGTVVNRLSWLVELSGLRSISVCVLGRLAN